MRAICGVVLLVACSHVSASQAAPHIARECLVDTITVAKPAEFEADIKASFGESFLTPSKPNEAGLLRVPEALDAPLDLDFGAGAFVYSFHGWDVTSQAPEGVKGDGFFATIGGSLDQVGSSLDRKRLAVARALFEALTRAKETRKEHVAPKDTYDRSWTRTRRETPNGRLVCDKVIYPGTSPNPNYTCIFNQLMWTRVQDYGSGSCPAPSE